MLSDLVTRGPKGKGLGGRWAGRMVDGPGRSGQSRWGMGVVVPLLRWPECTKTRRFHSDLTKISRLRRVVFVF